MATKKPTPAQLAARAKFAAAARAGTLKRKKAKSVVKRAPAKKATVRRSNPVTKGTRTTKRKSLVAGIHYAVLFYAGKTKPTGKPDFIFPARDKTHAESIVRALEAKGASGVAIIEKTKASV